MKDKEKKEMVLTLINKYKKSLLILNSTYKKNIKLLEEYFATIEVYNNKLAKLELQFETEEDIGKYLQLQRLKFTNESSSNILNNMLENEMIAQYSGALTSRYYDFNNTMKYLVVKKFEKEINNINLLGLASYFLLQLEDKLLNLALIKLFRADDNTLIHEITHCISHEILFYDLENDMCLIKKGYSLNIGKDEFDKFVELITQKISENVTRNLHNKGIFLLDKRFNSRIRNENKGINMFFDAFEEYIKEGYITLNENSLIERVGKKNFEEFASLVSGDVEDDKIIKLIQRMKDYSRQS